jgi:nucleotide-binding universal stress UspA family protein
VANDIVVGFDNSSRSRDALTLARLLARAVGGRVIVVRVVASEEAAADADWPEQSGSWVAEQLALVDSSPGHALRALADRRHAVGIAVGSTRRGAVGRITVGSVARHLLGGAPCTVAVAPAGLASGHSEPDTIGVAYDGSAEADRALEAASRLAPRLAARVSIVAVARWPSPPTTGRGFIAGDEGARFEIADTLARASREAMEGIPDGVRGDMVVEVGDPASILAARSRDLDLLVCGSHRRGRVHQVLLGSVSAALVDRAECPLLVVPRGGQRVEQPLR